MRFSIGCCVISANFHAVSIFYFLFSTIEEHSAVLHVSWNESKWIIFHTINNILGFCFGFITTKAAIIKSMCSLNPVNIGSGIYFIRNLLDFLFDPISTVIKYVRFTLCGNPFITIILVSNLMIEKNGIYWIGLDLHSVCVGWNERYSENSPTKHVSNNGKRTKGWKVSEMVWTRNDLWHRIITPYNRYMIFVFPSIG